MGYMRHNAIVVTSWNKELTHSAATAAEGFGMTVSPVIPSPVNGEYSFLVAPDGSKEGWDESDRGDSAREDFRKWLSEHRYEDGSTSLSWVEIAYGPDDRDAVIEHHAWEHMEVKKDA